MNLSDSLTFALSKVVMLKMKAHLAGDSVVKLILRVGGILNWHYEFSGDSS